MYEYNAICTSVYDGDTITVEIDLGFHASMKKMKLRLFGIDAPEMRGPEKVDGKVTRDWLREQILGKKIRVHTLKDKTGKYGRWLANIYPIDNQTTSYNSMMVSKDLAVEASY